MQIETTPLIDFSEVLLKPKRSTLKSRKDVSLTRKFVLPHAPASLSGIPIVAANMDTVGTMEAAYVLAEQQMFTALHKHYTLNEYEAFFVSDEKLRDYVFYTMGMTDADYIKFEALRDRLGFCPMICIDVANGYSEAFIGFCAKMRETNPEAIIMAGNVCTPEITEELILKGIDIIKVGIGGGCFVPGSIVHTKTGNKPIEKIDIGDLVRTHTNKWQKVTNKFRYTDKKKTIKINDIEATPNHEFYVVHKMFKALIVDDNIHDYATWIPASDLTEDYLLISS